MRAAYSPQSPAPLELFLHYMDEAITPQMERMKR